MRKVLGGTCNPRRYGVDGITGNRPWKNSLRFINTGQEPLSPPRPENSHHFVMFTNVKSPYVSYIWSIYFGVFQSSTPSLLYTGAPENSLIETTGTVDDLRFPLRSPKLNFGQRILGEFPSPMGLFSFGSHPPPLPPPLSLTNKDRSYRRLNDTSSHSCLKKTHLDPRFGSRSTTFDVPPSRTGFLEGLLLSTDFHLSQRKPSSFVKQYPPEVRVPFTGENPDVTISLHNKTYLRLQER